MPEYNLLKSLPKGKRNVKERNTLKTDDHIEISRKYGQMYFDGPREYGYGGYYYDGRWRSVAVDVVERYNLKKGQRVLDVGCAKGFLVKDLLELGIDAYGIDVSEYAIRNCEPEVIGRLHVGNALKLNFPDKCFEAVLSINTLHNLEREDLKKAIREIKRVSYDEKSFIQVDSYKTEEQKKIFESWVLTAKYYGYPEEWIKLFNEVQYSGDWYWTIIE